MVYTVKQLADLAGISPRTLHYYDEIALLKPSSYGENRYRYYDDEAMLRLQQILFYREMGLSLGQIQELLDQPDFDVLEALQAHKIALGNQVERLNLLINTVDKTINYLNGGIEMSKKDIFAGFSEEQQEQYTEEARQRWDPQLVDESMKRWKNYSPEKQKAIIAESSEIYSEIFENMEQGRTAANPAVQTGVAKWHQNMRYFYEPTIEVLRGLGQMYVDSPDFRVTFEKFSPEFPEFLCEAIQVYCEGKE
ncbi:MAG: MerR family transcriptional regulator [Anaerolineales bacterium]|nr:MerR family transcriptional regulator [Chloroflexota bacterium]MBL6979674.1 MerR family transcriptional regulator [Anaerolineales bacterium]